MSTRSLLPPILPIRPGIPADTAPAILLRPLIDWALDRYGRRPFLLDGLSAFPIASLTFLLANSLGFLYLGRVAESIGSSLTWLTADRSQKGDRGRNFGQLEQARS